MVISPTSSRQASLAEAQEHIATLVSVYRSKKEAFFRIARKVGVTQRRVKAIFRREAARIEDWEMTAIRREKHRIAQQEMVSNAAFFDREAVRLESIDPDFYGAEIASYRAMAMSCRSYANQHGVAVSE